MYKINFLIVTILAVVMLLSKTQAQPTIKFKTLNETQVDANSVRFDIYIENTGGSAASYLYSQSYFDYTSAVLNSGTPSCSYVAGTSDLSSSHTSLFTFSTGTLGRLGIYYSAAPAVANEVSIGAGSSIRLGTFEFSTTVSAFSTSTMGKSWREYSGSNPKTKYFYVLSGAAVELGSSGNGSSSNYTYSVGTEPLLPVELTSFMITNQGRNINLNWVTKTEVNSSMFEIERQQTSNSGSGGWEKIGNISASGNSNSPKEYSFIDTRLNSGKYSYRLKMIDNDGTSEYSEAVEAEVELPREFALSQNYPNPFNPTTRIDYQLPFDSEVTIELFNMNGEKTATLVNNKLSAGYYIANIDASKLNLSSGVYIYRITARNEQEKTFMQSKKLVLMK